jgi:hypothetical protein
MRPGAVRLIDLIRQLPDRSLAPCVGITVRPLIAAVLGIELALSQSINGMLGCQKALVRTWWPRKLLLQMFSQARWI